MCGIAVAIDWEGAVAAVRTLMAGIEHRGDVSDPVFAPRSNTAMATRRLRIVDVDRAVQPQLSFDGRLAVSFNGEIYNHAELRRELEALGVPFRTESDTEVLANALQVWGAKALARLNGMFAFVALDLASGEFLAARDPFGVKPLYVMQSETGFLFCSEIRPLLAASESGDVLKLPPGYMLTRKICAGYRHPLRGPFEGRTPGNARALDALLSEAVRIRLPQGLPVATQLSGGIDSTLVAHYARRHRSEAPAYHLGSATDLPFVVQYASLSGIELRHVPFDLDSDESFALIPQVVAASESFEPSVIRGAVCSWKVSEAMHRDGYRVALCGDGADEIFAGYAALEYALAADAETGRAARQDCIDSLNATCLQRIDRCGMRFSLEIREPFLDPSVAAYGLDLAPHALVDQRGGAPVGKKALRALYDLYPRELPRSIRDRRKLAFDRGAGLGRGWEAFFEQAISDRDYRDGAREFAAFDMQSKEELFNIRVLATAMDINRVPHLKGRARLALPIALPEHALDRVVA